MSYLALSIYDEGCLPDFATIARGRRENTKRAPPFPYSLMNSPHVVILIKSNSRKRGEEKEKRDGDDCSDPFFFPSHVQYSAVRADEVYNIRRNRRSQLYWTVSCSLILLGSGFLRRPNSVALSRLNSKAPRFLTWRLAAAATAALC